MADYIVTDSQLSSIADAIRTKGGTSEPLAFPSAFVMAINNIPSGSADHTVEDAIIQGKLSGAYENSRVSNVRAFAFYGVGNITAINFPSCEVIGSSAFRYCNSLSVASFPACTEIKERAFGNCDILMSLYLLGSSVPVLATTAFTNTPLSGGHSEHGSIYVPATMVQDYYADAQWSRFKSWIVGFE